MQSISSNTEPLSVGGPVSRMEVEVPKGFFLQVDATAVPRFEFFQIFGDDSVCSPVNEKYVDTVIFGYESRTTRFRSPQWIGDIFIEALNSRPAFSRLRED